MNIPQLDSTYIANTYARFPVTIARGKGSLVWDADDKVYIDMATGIAVNSFGIADPAWIRAVTEQLCTVQHASNLYYTAPDAQLAQLLCEKTGMKKVFFSNSGAEANECAIKAARKYAADHKGPEYHTIITLKNSFHGRTITTLAATGQDVFHHDFLPLTEGFAYAEANNLDDLKAQVAAHKCAAIMMEVVQGEGGVIPLTQEFVKGAAQLAAEQDLLLICDEVQIGNGRSGKLYGYMHYGITPDIVSTAKGLAGRDAARREGAGRAHPRQPRLYLRRQPRLLRRRAEYSAPARRPAAAVRAGKVRLHRQGSHRRQGRQERHGPWPDARCGDRAPGQGRHQ